MEPLTATLTLLISLIANVTLLFFYFSKKNECQAEKERGDYFLEAYSILARKFMFDKKG